jgi:hypothetical protein
METTSAGVHIFGRLQGKAVDKHFIYLEISPEQDFTTFLKELKVNNGFENDLVFFVSSFSPFSPFSHSFSPFSPFSHPFSPFSLSPFPLSSPSYSRDQYKYMKCDFDFTFRIRYFMINLALNVYDFRFSIMKTISAGEHIFERLQGKAMDNHFSHRKINLHEARLLLSEAV